MREGLLDLDIPVRSVYAISTTLWVSSAAVHMVEYIKPLPKMAGGVNSLLKSWHTLANTIIHGFSY